MGGWSADHREKWSQCDVVIAFVRLVWQYPTVWKVLISMRLSLLCKISRPPTHLEQAAQILRSGEKYPIYPLLLLCFSYVWGE